MNEPVSLDRLFKQKIFRIPDYQRGYAWQRPQYKDFWEDLVNLAPNRQHYTGVLTFTKVATSQVQEDAKEYWLLDDDGYDMFNIVDGQQRLTTFVIFLQSLMEVVRELDENKDKPLEEIYLTENLNLRKIADKFLFKVKPSGDRYRTYKFGYTRDNPSYEYLRHRIFNEDGAGTISETFYTLNLRNAKTYFKKQLEELYLEEGLGMLQAIYKRLTKDFLVNEYIIKDEFDVFVAFETMNNRGKKLSDLELLKNRLIYLTTLYDDDELDPAERKSLRDDINDAWKEVYYQLGRNDKKPLNDDDFLKAHWTMFFKYSRKRGNDYIRFLLDEQFPPQRIMKKIEKQVPIDDPEELRTSFEFDDADPDHEPEEFTTVERAELAPTEIRDFVHSLKSSAVHWFNSHYPHLADGISQKEKESLERLIRIGMGYFRPLVMAVAKNVKKPAKRIKFYDAIERFIFLTFTMGRAMRTYRSSEYNNAARALDRGEKTLKDLTEQLNVSSDYLFDEDGIYDHTYLLDHMRKKFESGKKGGFYRWNGLKYFLYEYELSLLAASRQKKVNWEDLEKTPKDKVSIEHIFPQTPSENWLSAFEGLSADELNKCTNTLGNLVLLSMSINSSLQNDDFDDKKLPKISNDQKIRNGYSDGSHSEIEIAQEDHWRSQEILSRGLRLLDFMEQRWNFKFESIDAKQSLLFLEFLEEAN